MCYPWLDKNSFSVHPHQSRQRRSTAGWERVFKHWVRWVRHPLSPSPDRDKFSLFLSIAIFDHHTTTALPPAFPLLDTTLARITHRAYSIPRRGTGGMTSCKYRTYVFRWGID